MTDCLFTDEIKDAVVLLQLVHIDSTHRVGEWNDLTPLEFGILSWQGLPGFPLKVAALA